MAGGFMKVRSAIFRIGLTLLFWVGWSGGFFSPPEAQADPYYKGKTVQIIVGTSTGGFNDFWARLLARQLPKYLEGSCKTWPAQAL
jgi:tripartite-type tricarboxylate transporter receptor subunit TctC